MSCACWCLVRIELFLGSDSSYYVTGWKGPTIAYDWMTMAFELFPVSLLGALWCACIIRWICCTRAFLFEERLCWT